jgi:hypothetical protein
MARQVHLVIPAGTKVVARTAGRVGVVARVPDSPDHAYRVRFPEGHEESFRRGDLTIFRQDQSDVPAFYDEADLFRFVQYRCVVGSHAYGLAGEGSDVDRRGFYLPPAELHWSLARVPEQIERDPVEVYWELEKFLRLALKANPNVLECL